MKMDKSLYECLIKWLKTFADHSDITSESLSDGIAMGDILYQIAPEYFNHVWKLKILPNVGDNWRLKMSNLRKIHQGVMDYLSELPGQTISQFPRPDLNKICEHGDEIELGRLLQLILGCAINCEQKQKHIEAIMKMEEGVQAHIVNAIQDLMNREYTPGVPDGSGTPGTLSGPWFGPASFHPHMKTLVEQLESTSLAKEDMTRRCNELDLQVSVLTDEKDNLKKEKDKLLERIEILENGGDIGAQSFRYKEIRKQVDTLQDDLYKLESSRDEYRSRVENLERENKEIIAKNEELQILADQARSLKDEVDALKDMSDRVAVYEGTVETLKKRMEELSDLKRQIKKLEEKNSEYMQINIELEEEVKKSATLRPQLDLYKKQVGDLHQKLSEEEKKMDRQVFENKKVSEKLEAVSQEKERMIVERDMLKENLEELKCTVSALGSPEYASKPLPDLAGIDTLEIISPEIREKLVRLQHENRVLKQKANEKPNESAPVLQSLLNDLQERHDKLLQENRWGDKFCPPSPYSSPWPPFGRTRSHSRSFIDSYFSLDTSQKLKLLRRNLKWASESDLLILRQPSKFMKSYFYSNMNDDNKSLTLPPFSLLHTSNNMPSPQKDNPIVIRHIHEFKMPPSPTNDDSGCCRTSPSSYEGCEDHPSGSFGTHTPDYVGTLDSGISGMYRCISPVIPSIAEECTTHHVSDILPALISIESNVLPVMHHSHPIHNICYHCCSPKALAGDLGETSYKEKVSSHTLCSCMSNFHISNKTLDYNTNDHCSHSLPENCASNSPLNSLSQQDPFNVSSNGKQSSTYLVRTDPSNSPTPHNSPRLPHSIHNNRSKKASPQNMFHSLAKNLPLSQRGKFYVEPDKGKSLEFETIPIKVTTEVETKLSKISGVPLGDRNSINQQRVASKTEITRQLELQLSQNDLLKLPEPVGAQGVTIEPDGIEYALKPSERQRCQHEKTNSNFSDHVRSKTPDRIKSMFSERFRASFREKNFKKSPEKEKEGRSFRKLRSKSLDKYKSKGNSKLVLHSNFTESPTPVDENKKICKVVSDIDVSLNSLNNKFSNKKYQSILKHSVSLDHQLNDESKLINRPSIIQDFSDSERKQNFSNLKENYISNSTHTSLRIKAHANPPVLSRPNSFCKFGERLEDAPPAIVNLFRNCAKHPLNKEVHKNIQLQSYNKNISVEDNDKIREAPASLENICNANLRNSSNRAAMKTKSADVTLLTDTMFTHFVVTPKQSDMFFRINSRKHYSSQSSMLNINTLEIPEPRYSKGCDLASDTDTDIEMIENRLVSSCYGAPLVSSESNISFYQGDQTDLEPSATDYASEIDFDPEKYKFSHSRSLLETDLDKTDSYFDDTLLPLTRTDDFLSKNKVPITALKTKNTIGLNNKSIIKVKNKTAKTVVAETFNAMFTFCTP